MNVYDQSDVAYETAPKETRSVQKRKNAQFPGDVMPQGNKDEKGREYVQKEYPANPRPIQRFEEYR
jgi:hypothetical protein